MEITKKIKYIGVDDLELDLFEGQFQIPNGMAYNSYLINDEKIAIIDSVEIRFSSQWLGAIERETKGRSPDFLIIQHMEPDHSSSVMRFAERFPKAVIVASARAFEMMKSFFGEEFTDRRIVVSDKDFLDLGGRKLQFISAPMVHWPEVIMTYDTADKLLFSADAFGKFGAHRHRDEWKNEARRYYFGIVGKYGKQVQALLKKLKGYEIKHICSLHGPVLSENLGYYLNLYDRWSAYQPESSGVCIAYASIYGNTKEAAELLAKSLNAKNVEVSLNDLSRCDMFEAVAQTFKYDRLVLASATYNADVFSPMKEFINHLTARNYQNRYVAFVENGSWSPMATSMMKFMLKDCTNLKFAKTEVKINSSLNETSARQIENLACELAKVNCDFITEIDDFY